MIKGGTNWGAVGSFATQNIKFPKRKKRWKIIFSKRFMALSLIWL
jgi:hypothetical protein